MATEAVETDEPEDPPEKFYSYPCGCALAFCPCDDAKRCETQGVQFIECQLHADAEKMRVALVAIRDSWNPEEPEPREDEDGEERCLWWAAAAIARAALPPAKPEYSCPKGHTADVQVPAWIDANTHAFSGDDYTTKEYWCGTCAAEDPEGDGHFTHIVILEEEEASEAS